MGPELLTNPVSPRPLDLRHQGIFSRYALEQSVSETTADAIESIRFSKARLATTAATTSDTVRSNASRLAPYPGRMLI